MSKTFEGLMDAMEAEELRCEEPEKKTDRPDEAAFARKFISRHKLMTYSGSTFGVNGLIPDDHLRHMVYDELLHSEDSSLRRGSLKNRVTSVIDAIKAMTYVEDISAQEHLIHYSNGTLNLQTVEFTEEKDVCLNRLCVPFTDDPHTPERWLKFLDELLYPEDIPTLQQFMGYLMIPSTRAQKMLMILGRGGEGKSRIGTVPMISSAPG